MKTSKEMQNAVTKIATKQGIDITQPGAIITLTNEPYQPLVIQCFATNQVSVSHTYIQNGDIMRDPEIVFFTGYGVWVPIEITQSPMNRYVRAAWLKGDFSAIEKFMPYQQADIAYFAKIWTRNIREQNYLKASAVCEKGAL